MTKVALVVDDSMAIRKLVGRTLQGAGFEVVEAMHGKAGLEVLAQRTVNFIITDYNMPVMDGIDFMRGIRGTEAHRFTPVIFLTTEVEPAKRQEAREAGATAWIEKPFTPEKVLSVVNKVVQAS